MMKKTLFISGIVLFVVTVILFVFFTGTVVWVLDSRKAEEPGGMYSAIFSILCYFGYFYLYELSGFITEIVLLKNAIDKYTKYRLLSLILAIVCLCMMVAGVICSAILW